MNGFWLLLGFDKLSLRNTYAEGTTNGSISESRLLQLALERLEGQKRDIDAEIAELRGRQDYNRAKQRGRPRNQASVEHTPSNTANKSEPKKKVSAAHRLAISQAMKQRWANRNKDSKAVQ